MEWWKIKGGSLAWDREKEHQRVLMLRQKATAKLAEGRGGRYRGRRADGQGEVLLAASPFASTAGGLQLSETGTSLAVPALARSL